MKIAIVGPITIPGDKKISELIPETEPICHTSFHPHPWIFNLAKGLSILPGNEVHIVSVTNNLTKNFDFIFEDIHFHLIKAENKYVNALTFFRKEIIKTKRILHKINPDIVHAQSRGYTTYAAIKTGYPAVVTNHGQLTEHYAALGKKDFRYFIFRCFEKRVNRRMKYCIGVSPNCTNNCKSFLNEKNIFLIENAISPVFFEKKQLTGSNTILFIGSITPLKQVRELIIAVSKVEKCRLRLIYQSANTQYFDEIKKLVSDLQLTERIDFVGSKNSNELTDEIASCTALCLPSLYESFGMVLAEAMAIGKPVIAANIEGPSFIVKHNINGLLFSPGNVDELVKSIDLLINDKNITNTLGENAQKDAFLRFSPESVGQRTYEVYKKVLSDLTLQKKN